MTEIFSKVDQFVVQMKILGSYEAKKRARQNEAGPSKVDKMPRREESPKL